MSIYRPFGKEAPSRVVLTRSLFTVGMFTDAETPRRDRTGWLRTQSDANQSPTKIPC